MSEGAVLSRTLMWCAPIDSRHQGDSFGLVDFYDNVASKLADLAKIQVRAKLFKNRGGGDQ